MRSELVPTTTPKPRPLIAAATSSGMREAANSASKDVTAGSAIRTRLRLATTRTLLAIDTDHTYLPQGARVGNNNEQGRERFTGTLEERSTNSAEIVHIEVPDTWVPPNTAQATPTEPVGDD